VYGQATLRASIAAGLARARKRAGLTQPQLADRLSLSTSAVRHRERGRHAIYVHDLPAIAQALSTTVHALLAEFGIGEPQKRRTPRSKGAPGGRSA